ncbi:MAG: LytR/AlgR family response regulator transcription factor [Leptothrix ochracea]|uniref:LytR/AlgR family response regulator transcription factor n=1 Tax=Leptothrix ochracea TaxID=735331 RepID=UPI0034E22C6B
MTTTHPTALIAEDEPLLAQALAMDLLGTWPELRLLAPAHDGDEALERALTQQPDVLFLDIRMPGRSGLEVAQTIVDDWPTAAVLPLIVFVTAYDQYAVQAFEASAVDYVLKPVQPARLATTCQRLRHLLSQRGGGVGEDALLQQLRQLLTQPAPASERLSVIQVSSGNAIHLVPVDEVIYFEAADKYIRVITAEREWLIRTALRDLLAQLDPALFWQVHRGTVVRASQIAQAVRDESGRLVLSLRQRPEKLAVSRLYTGRFKGM